MSKVAIMTDSNSGITQDEAKKLGVFVQPMPFYINEKLYYEDISLTQEQFYEALEDKDAVMISLQKAYFMSKEINKKYTPKKYRKPEETDGSAD